MLGVTNTVEQLWKAVEDKLTSNKEPYQTLNAIYEVQLSDAEDAALKTGKLNVTRNSGLALMLERVFKSTNYRLNMIMMNSKIFHYKVGFCDASK